MHLNETVDYWRTHINGLIIEQYHDKLKGNVADFGSGAGFMTAIISELPGVKSATGFDVKEPKVKATGKLKFQQKDITKIVAGKTKFDAAITFHTLEHIKDVGQAVSKMASLIKVGGYLIVSVPFMGAYWNDDHVNQFNLDNLKNLLETGDMSIKTTGKKLFKTVELYHDTRVDGYGDKHDCVTGLFKRL